MAEALDEALIFRFDSLDRMPRRSMFKSDNGLIFKSRRYPVWAQSGICHFVSTGAKRFGGAVHRRLKE